MKQENNQKEYRNGKRDERRGGRRPQGDGRKDRRDGGRRASSFRDRDGGYKPEETAKNEFGFKKNSNGFMVVSFIVNKGVEPSVVLASLRSVLAINAKKKVVVSFEDPQNKEAILELKQKLEGSSVFYFFPKSKMGCNSVGNIARIHSEVLGSFKSDFFLAVESIANIREFAVEKMLSFLVKPNDTVAVAPKFYNKDGSMVTMCRRFFSIWNFLPEFSAFIKSKNVENIMMERGEIGYNSIHRVDWSTMTCMLFLTEALLKVRRLPSCFRSSEARDASLCKALSAKTKGKVTFYPHSRVVLSAPLSLKISLWDKAKYILKNGLSFS